MRRVQSGFTLVELVIVIAIIGILSAVALPKFINLGSEARLAKVDALAGALTSTANMVYSKCLVTPSCDVDATANAATLDGVVYQIIYGYPNAGNSLNTQQIDTMLDVSGFDLALLNHKETIFKVPGAPDPNQCAVVYTEANASKQITVTKRISGC